MHDMSFNVESSHNKAVSHAYQVDLKVDKEPSSDDRGMMIVLAGTVIRNSAKAIAKGETIDSEEIKKIILDSFQKYVPDVGVSEIKISLAKQNKR